MKRNSYAKVNLDLRVIGKRLDGFHELDMIIAPIELHDVIEIEMLPQGKNDWQCQGIYVAMDEENLIIKALRKFQEKVFFPYGLKILLTKNIPLQAGLGGGSSNAATALMMINELAGFPLSTEQLHTIALELGSDVPFFLEPSLAIVKGRGEKITRFCAPSLNQLPISIINPKIGSSTAHVFKHVKTYSFPVSEVLRELLLQGDTETFFASINNDLLIPAAIENPVIERIYQDLIDRLNVPIMMTGSGSCIVVYDKLTEEQITQIKSDIPEVSSIILTNLLSS